MKNLLREGLAAFLGASNTRKLLFYIKRSLGIVDLNTRYDILTEAVLCQALTQTAVCVDVGCHCGDILQILLKQAPQGQHFAFEPLPDLYQHLVQTFQDENVVVSDIALSDRVGNVSFQHVVSNPGYSGFKERVYERQNENVQQITVKTDCLDNLLPEDQVIDFIKIDVEGAEYQVLQGAQKTIQRNKPIIIFEHGLGSSEFYETTPQKVYDFLAEQCEMKISLLEKWLKKEKSLTREEFIQEYKTGRNYYFIAFA
jgi:FkbM family methyltransferase